MSAQPLSVVAQRCMDLYYQQFKSNNDFFDLTDFADYAGDTVGGYYNQMYQQMRAELRAERKQEIVSFSESVLVEEDVKIKSEESGDFAHIVGSYMSFPFDEQATGVQFVFPASGMDCPSLERVSLSQLWQLKYVPITDRIFWCVETGNKIRFIKNSISPLNTVRILYVPAVGPDMKVPDSIVDYVTTNTVTKMKEIEKGTVVKQSLDQNSNKILETEINKTSLRN